MKIKRIALGLLTALLLTLPAKVQAQLTFTTNNGAITITGYFGNPTNLNIPSNLIGYSVTSIGNYAFYGCSNLTSVTIPNSITNIGIGAFRFCTSLTNVTIPNSVINIGDTAFEFCTSLTSVTIPNSVINIGDFAFYNCSSLNSVTIPDSVSSIGDDMFNYCTALTNINIGSGVTSISSYMFNGCTNLMAIVVGPNNPTFSSVGGVLFNLSQDTLLQFPFGLGGSYTIPNAVRTIYDNAFADCFNLTSVTIPKNVITIGAEAFYQCSSLSNVTIGSGLTSVGSAGFNGCYKLSNLTIGCPTIRSWFSTLPLISVTILNSVTNINGGAFLNCDRLTNLYIGSGVISIGSQTFQGCTRLTGVTIPANVTNIGSAVFANCPSLKSIMVAPNNPAYSSVGGVLFDVSQANLIQYPGGIGGSYAIPNTVTNISEGPFVSCSGLTSLTIPTSVISIASYAFEFCTGLTKVYFQGNSPIPTNDFSVFFGAPPLTVYYLPGTIGWGSTFDGRPTALWLPQVQSSGTYLGVQTNQFGFNINWASGQMVVVEACTNLANPTWQPVQTNTLPSSGTAYFSDPQWTNYPGRFYRLRSP